jgi:muramidase (phage lysozyme)
VETVVARFLSDDLTPDEWNRRRNLQVATGDPNGGVLPGAPSLRLHDGLPPNEWQRVRAMQASGSPSVVAARRAPSSARQWELEEGQASGAGLRAASEAVGRAVRGLFGGAPQPGPIPARPTSPAPTRAVYSRRDAARDLGASYVLDRLGAGEQDGRPASYDVTYGYGAFVPPGSKKLTEMTFDEVAALQKEMLTRQRGRRGDPSSVVGMYQFRAREVENLRKRLGFKGSDLFTPGVQDVMAREILDEIGYADFLTGEVDATTFQSRLARRWASVASPGTGRSRYGQHTGTSSDEVQDALESAKAEASHLMDLGDDPYARRWR